MSTAVLTKLDTAWGTAPGQSVAVAQEVSPSATVATISTNNRVAASRLAASTLANLPPQADIYHPSEQVTPATVRPSPLTCEWIGRRFARTASTDVARDLTRIVSILRDYPIEPQLYEGGGIGFDYPHVDGWARAHREILDEFSDLFFTAAGDAFIARYRDQIKVLPRDVRSIISKQSRFFQDTSVKGHKGRGVLVLGKLE